MKDGLPAVVYALTFPNGKKYIGATTNLKKRWIEHVGSSSKTNRRVSQAIKEFGKDSVKVEILSHHSSITEAYQGEIAAIAELKTFAPDGYNYTIGGIGGFWDYGPLGTELKRNIKNEWWKSIVYQRDDVVGIDASIIMNPVVWEKSGHTEAFSDPLVECKICHLRFRADKKEELIVHEKEHNVRHSGKSR